MSFETFFLVFLVEMRLFHAVSQQRVGEFSGQAEDCHSRCGNRFEPAGFLHGAFSWRPFARDPRCERRRRQSMVDHNDLNFHVFRLTLPVAFSGRIALYPSDRQQNKSDAISVFLLILHP